MFPAAPRELGARGVAERGAGLRPGPPPAPREEEEPRSAAAATAASRTKLQ